MLVAHGPLSAEARARLEVLARSDDGFAIAEKDLELRGPGDFFGTRQWGVPALRVSDLVRDRELVERARAEAFRFAASEPPESCAGLLDAFGCAERFRLAGVG